MKKEGYVFILLSIILFISFIAYNLQYNQLTGKITRTREVSNENEFMSVLNIQSTRTDIGFIREILVDPLYQALIILNTAGGKDSLSADDIENIKKNLEEHKNFIMSLNKPHKQIEQLNSLINYFPDELSYLFPKKINLNDYRIKIFHEDDLTNDENIKSIYKFYAVKNNKQFEIILDKIEEEFNNFNSGAYFYNDIIYVSPAYGLNINEVPKESTNDDVRKSKITGYPIYSPSSPFNYGLINVAALIPYNTIYPLPSNYQSYLQSMFSNVNQYFLDNSDNNAVLNFTTYGVFDSTFNPGTYYTNAFNLISLADPMVNYSQYKFVLKVIPKTYDTIPGGSAGMTISFTGMPVYITTNDGPLASADPQVFINFNAPSTYNNYAMKVFKHEIGHTLTFWHPQFRSFFNGGLVPHASGVGVCNFVNPINICTVLDYEDRLDTMGWGLGSYQYHIRSYFMGLSPVSRVQTITNPGTYNLCDIEHTPPSGCPQEILMENIVGNNLALELRTNSGPESVYSCPGYFNGVIVRVTDREEGGGLNNTIYGPNNIINLSGFIIYQQGGGDVIIPYSLSTSNCGGYPITSIPNFVIPPGQTMNTPLGPITVQSINNLPGGGKQATVNINFIQPQCIFAAPSGSVNPNTQLLIYSNTLWSVNNIIYKVRITNNDVCITSSEIFTVKTDVFGLPTPTTSASITVLSPPINSTNTRDVNFPVPTGLIGLNGIFPFKLTVAKQSNPLHNFTINGTISLIQYNPEIYGPYGVSNCTDLDPIPFTFQNLGANFNSYNPNTGAYITLNPPVPGFPPNSYVPDFCLLSDYRRATDIVCGANTGIPGLTNSAFFIIQDCRFVLNDPSAICFPGGHCD